MPAIHLQAIGDHPARPVAEARVGDSVVYNYGITYKIVGVDVRDKWVYLSLVSPEGKLYNVKKKPGTLIGYREQS